MTIHRICVEVPVEKFGKWRRPKIKLEKGFNLRVLEYKGDKAIVEIWCSDHEILKPNERKGKSDLEDFVSRKGLKVVNDYPNRPKIVGRIAVVVPHNANVDMAHKQVVFGGKLLRFLRAEKYRDRFVKLVLDEG